MPKISRDRPVKRHEGEGSESGQWSSWSPYQWDSEKQRYVRYRTHSETHAYRYEYCEASVATSEMLQTNSYVNTGISTQQHNQGHQTTNGVPDQGVVLAPSMSSGQRPGPWPLAHSHSDPAPTTQTDCYLNIEILDSSNTYRPHIALMDTGAEVGLCIAEGVVEKLGLQVDTQALTQLVKVGNDQVMASQGQVEIYWKVSSGKKIHHNTFKIFQSSAFDVIFDQEFLQQQQIVVFNISGLLPLAPATSKSSHHKAQREQAQQEQQEAAARSEERKKKRENKDAEKKNKHSSSGSSSQHKKHK